MANPNATVSRYVRLEVPPQRAVDELLRSEGGLSVELDDGRRVRLDPTEPKSPGFAQVLAGLAELRWPVYLEVDPETSSVSRILIPNIGRVAALRETAEGLEVELDTSHARLLLPRDRPDVAEFARVLREGFEAKSPVIVTVDDAQNIIDARFFRPGPDDGPSLSFLSEDLAPIRRAWPWRPFRWIWYWPIWPWRWQFGCISFSHAQQVFDAMSATSCNPLTVPPPCIPFMYPDDGCWARAHEMARLMIDMGLSPRKVWIQGWLHTPTRNNPNCFVNWGWHVAPTLCVRRPWWRGWWWRWGRQTMVIDPSLFTTPVSVPTWKGVQGDPNATLTYTDASDYRWGETDPTYAKTNDRLNYYRLQLQLRAISVGPPPYANCP